MLKYIAVFAVVFGLAVYIARQDERAAQERANNPPIPNKSAVPAETNKDHPQENVENAEWNTPRWYGFFRWPNGTTTWAIIITLLAIAEQTSQIRKSAKAAADSAEAFLTSERAWALLTPQLVDKLQPTGKHHGMLFKWGIKNVGRTPARIVETETRVFRIAPVDLKKLPIPPHYVGPPIAMNNFLVVPNDSIPVAWLVEDGEEFTEDDIDAIRDGAKLTLFAHGFVTYLDTFGKRHTTRACHTYICRGDGEDGFEPYVFAPPEYSECD